MTISRKNLKGIRILTGQQLAGLPETTGLPPYDLAQARGLELHQRGFRAGLKAGCSLILHSLPLLVGARLLGHFGLEPVPVWALAAGGLAALFCAGGLMVQAGALVIIMAWRTRIIFIPGRLLFRRKTLLGLESQVFHHRDILGLTLRRRGGPLKGDSELSLKYRRTDGGQTSERLIRDPGRTGLCLWVADLILDALAPATVPFHDE